MTRVDINDNNQSSNSEISWTGAHEIFQVREYDAGASPTSSERGASANTFWTHDKLFKNF
jgi:hypothetical protein